MKSKFQYDVALSFAGEDRPYVEKVYVCLSAQGIKPFYDQAEEIALWGKDLVARFDEIYRNEARYCVMFVSKFYLQKVWPRHERRSALARAITDEGYILPTRFDETDIPGLPPTVHYVDLRHKTPEQLGDMIIQKLGRGVQSIQATDSIGSIRRPKVTKSFDPYKESQSWIDNLVHELEKQCKDLEISFSHFSREGKQCLRFVVNGKPIYAIDIQLGGFHRDHGLSFSYANGEMHMTSGYNAFADLEWDKERECIVLKMNDFSVFARPANEKQAFTQPEFFEYMWEKICDAIEKND